MSEEHKLYPSLGKTLLTQESNLHFHLKQLNSFPPPSIQIDLASSSITHLPIIGKFWHRLRSTVHRTVVLYVARLAQHETSQNNELLDVINELARLTTEQQTEIEELRDIISTRKSEQ